MLFFELDFLLRFLLPLSMGSAALKAFGMRTALPWLGIGASLVFLYQSSDLSVLVALLSIAINYFAARLLLNSHSRRVLAAAITANLIVLGYFKYSVFVSHLVFGIPVQGVWIFALPLGISFYTFQQIAFLMDVYRGKVTSFSFRTYALFKLFFPQFIAGPIVHFERVRASYERWPTFNARSIRFGLTMIAIGFAKKLVADQFAAVANPLFAAQASLSGYGAWAAAIAFALQIYLDFSGYSDMAVGIARLFGVSLPFNFNSPYRSKSAAEFWRRWHITLSNWLRDYLYIPLGGNRHGRARMYAALMLTMALGGLWHGAGAQFVVWGIVHGLALVWCRIVRVRFPAALSVAATLVFLTLTWVLFRSTSLGGAWLHYAAMFHPLEGGIGVELSRVINLILPFVPVGGASQPHQLAEVGGFVAVIAACLVAPNSQQIALWLAARRVKVAAFADLTFLAGLVLLLSIAFVSPDTVTPFIYFQF